MILLDTNIPIDLVTTGPPQARRIRDWLAAEESLASSSIAWSEFCNAPVTREQMDAVHAVLNGRVISFDEAQAEQTSRLFHDTGRRRGSHPDCMIAAGMCLGATVATRNIQDFERFVPYGLKLNALSTN